MNILAQQKNLLHLDSESWMASLKAQLPLISSEVILVITMCLVILVPIFAKKNILYTALTAALGIALALVTVNQGGESGAIIFGGHLAIDPFSQYFKTILYVFALLVLYMWWQTGKDETQEKDTPDFLCLILGATIGMSLMSSASSLLMMFVAMETASMPSYALAGFRKRTKLGSEASMKYLIFGSASSAIMVYGMSLIYSATGSLDFGIIAAQAAIDFSPVLSIGIAATISGILFKLSAAPLHFWCPDVFQAAPTEITTFLSVASKGAAICLLVRLTSAFGAIEGAEFNGLASAVAVVGGITAFIGNLAAIKQTNLKRLLAYSSISHAGFMISAAGLVAIQGESKVSIESAILFYLLIYMFMNLGAFTCVALIKKHTGGEELNDIKGFFKRSPMLASLFIVCLMSLFGMPTAGGFMAKFYLFTSLEATPNAAIFMIIILLINTLISLFYYIKPAAIMIFKQDEQEQGPVFPAWSTLSIVAVMAAMIMWTGINPDSFMNGIAKSSTIKVTQTTPLKPIQINATQIIKKDKKTNAGH